MKKLMLIALMGFSVALTGCGDPCTEDAIDRLSDTIATIGKSGLEKDQALIERKAERAGKCAEKKAAEAKKGLGL